jgi:hypothetical protein
MFYDEETDRSHDGDLNLFPGAKLFDGTITMMRST